MKYKVGDKVVLNCSEEYFKNHVDCGESILTVFVDGVAEVVSMGYSGIYLDGDDENVCTYISNNELQYIKHLGKTEETLEESTMYTKEDITPVTDQEKMLTMALLRKIRGQGLESYQGKWVKARCNYISIDEDYRKLVEKTPLELPWQFIKKEFNYAAMDEDGEIYVYEDIPAIKDGCWDHITSRLISYAVLDIKTEGINWELSLTKRPEDV